LNRLYLLYGQSYIIQLLKMVVKTRSYYQENMCETDAAGGGEGARDRHRRCVKIMTPSFVEANTRTYKIYDPAMKRSKKNAVAAAATAVMEEEDDAAKVLMSLQHVHHTCLNPLSPITKFVYRIRVYNISRTLHCKTAYIIYDNKSRMLYVYTIISNRYYSTNEQENEDPEAPEVPKLVHTNDDDDVAVMSLPEPENTIQTKYSCFVDDTVKNYIMTMIVPPNVYDYYIQDDMFGVVTDKNVFSEIVASDESSFYDIEALINSKTSTETISGFNAFMLIHSRQFWYDPSASFSEFYQYSAQTVESILLILSQSR